jgi:hypothetical protein
MVDRIRMPTEHAQQRKGGDGVSGGCNQFYRGHTGSIAAIGWRAELSWGYDDQQNMHTFCCSLGRGRPGRGPGGRLLAGKGGICYGLLPVATGFPVKSLCSSREELIGKTGNNW